MGRLAEPINLADAQKHPSFKYIPSVKESVFRAFLGVPIIQRRQLLGVLVVQQRELRQYDESEESFLVTLATQMAAILSQSQSQRCSGNTGRRESARFLRRRAWLSQRAGKTRPCR
ncbi:phosphoenolpyruvate-protein phosphotransferase [Salmonella enterica subsp. enterica]|uniref:Phosphoenolpyruvate-protein phosphotransferase n=1 Tax=Salmonella enterica I TaxID=59201 RepID=A0A379WN38_SALET|nr:phosphoenolpyruvate-protein phosphotransferase [Salmonella enterica subsp. enterica]